MRFSTWDTPKYITCSELVNNILRLPRALKEYCEEILKKAGADVIIEDKRNSLSQLNLVFKGELNNNQALAAQKILDHDYGVLVSPTGSGKTVIAIKIIAIRNVPTLILVHRKEILFHWKKQLASFINLEEKEIGTMGGGKHKLTGRVDIAMLQTLSKKDNLQEVSKKYEQIIIDECHHIPAPSFDSILSRLSVRNSVGLTATPFRKDGHHPILYMLSGPIRYEIKEQPDENIVRKVYIKETSFSMPRELGEKPPIHETWEHLINDEERLDLVAKNILSAIKNNRHPLVLSERKVHLVNLKNALLAINSEELETCTFTGDLGKKTR